MELVELFYAFSNALINVLQDLIVLGVFSTSGLDGTSFLTGCALHLHHSIQTIALYDSNPIDDDVGVDRS